jgi:hypothetical protein
MKSLSTGFTFAEISNRMLNCSITDTEIENVVRNLPNNKEVGTDCIRNEYLKSTLHLLLPSSTGLLY